MTLNGLAITGLRTVDVRFPTSQHLDGSDAMNPDPDYSAAYVVLETDGGLEGHGLTFTIGRGNEICIAAIQALRPLVVGLTLRWIGPDKGAIHLATGAVVNAAWDLWAKAAGKPVWQLVAEMSPKELVRCIDFRYLTDCITPEWALSFLTRQAQDKPARIATLKAEGYPCYTTSAGWLGYDDIRRLTIARDEVGPDVKLMIDANQVWEVDQAIDWVRRLSFALWKAPSMSCRSTPAVWAV